MMKEEIEIVRTCFGIMYYVVDMILIDTNFWGADTIQCTKPRSYQTKYLERERLIPDRLLQAYFV